MRYRKLYLVGILLIAAALRLYGLAGRGLFYADETRYYRDAARVKESLHVYLGSAAPKGIKGFLNAISVSDKQSFAGKPGHTSLGFIGLYLFRDHQYSVLFISALLGIATVFLVFLIGRRFYDDRVGLLSALILAVCPVHIIFSTSFLTHSNQAFFLMLAVYLYLISHTFKKKPPYFLAGLSLGYAFLVHPSGLIYFAPFVLCEVFFLIRKKQKLGNIFLFIVCFLIPFLITVAISVFGKKEFGSLAVALKDSYAEQLIFTSGDAAYRGIETNKNLGPLHYTIMNTLVNGIGFAILLFVGIIFSIRHTFKSRTLSNFVVLILPVLLFVYWQFFAIHERLLREILILFPFFCIAVATFISKLYKKVALILVLLLMMEGVWYSAKVISTVKSGYPKLEKYLLANKVDKIITPSEYLAGTADVLMPELKNLRFYLVRSEKEAKDLKNKKGIDYIIISPGDWINNTEFRFREQALVRALEPSFKYFPSFYETVKTVGKIEWLRYYKENPEATSVTVYAVKDIGIDKGG